MSGSAEFDAVFNILEPQDFPAGPLERYLRDIYHCGPRTVSFEEFKVQWAKDNDERVSKLNQDNPVEYNHEVVLRDYPRHSITFFKRKGLAWMCSECDFAPNGGCGELDFNEALSRAGIRESDLKAQI